MIKITKKRNKVISLIVIFQITLLMIAIPSESYNIYQKTNLPSNSNINNNNFKILEDGLNLLISFFSINEIGIVSAAMEGACCLDTCDDVVPDYKECSQELIPTSCKDVQECKLGCCIDTEEGVCTANSPRGKCEKEGGEWNSGASCSINTCRKGCCVLGNNVKYITQGSCEAMSLGKMDFKQISYEACSNLITSQFEGACILNSGTCKFETESQCRTDKGVFYMGYLCSYEGLRTNCKKQDSIGCADGRNEIYWFDSCGNRENIYSSDKVDSWNEGKVSTKAESCSADSESTSCGNCALASSMCAATKTGEKHVVDGNYICKDLGCKNAPNNVGTKDRLNGEKWCLYDGFIGEGKDTVGSEHYLAMCINGNVEIDRCGEYRSSLCQQRTINGEGNSYTTASCVPNQAITCKTITSEFFKTSMDSNDLDRMKEKCNKEEHCAIKNVDISEYFKFSTCVPKYPRGDVLSDNYDGDICALASRDCTIYYEKNLAGAWVANENAECETPEFAKQMNELCVSQGDCGSQVNYLGKGTDSVDLIGKNGKKLNSKGEETEQESSLVGNAPKLYDWTNYVKYSETKEGQFVEPLDMTEELEGVLGKGYTPEKLSEWVGIITAGSIGAVYGAIQIFPWFKETYAFNPVGPPGQILSSPTLLGGIFNTLLTALVGMEVGLFLGDLFGRSPEATTYFMVTGGIAGGAIGAMIYFAEITSTTGPIGFWISAAIGVAAATLLLIGLITGYGERETRIVSFECLPWVAPNGGDDCEKCDDDPSKPCTKYKCESLGQLCKLKNENEENPICISLPRENVYPIISAGEVKTEGYKFTKEDKEAWTVDVEGCVQEYEDIWFTLNTDEYSQCKYSFERPSNPEFDLMKGELPSEKNLFTKEHNFYFKIPTIDNPNIHNLQEKDNGKSKEGVLDVYVKCQDGQAPPNFDVKEYDVKICVHSGPDEQEVNYAKIFTEPANNAVLSYGATEIDLKVWTDEKVESCKYDTTADKSYENMQNTFSLGNREFRGWLSSTHLTNLVAGENRYYIKCKDLSGNINIEEFNYKLNVSQSQLTISSVNFSYGVKRISAGGTFEVGLVPVSIDMQVKTSGGAKNGKAECFWGVAEEGNKWLFKNTYSSIHEQTLSPRLDGIFANYIYCQDEAGNNVTSVAEFTIDVDDLPPRITRVFKDGGSLKITTDELAKCYYSLDGCNFDIKDAIPMSTTFTKLHTATWNQGISYNIKCEDIFGNFHPDCGMKVIPSL